MTIEILPAQLANQIAAGEVVERPASVIKELIENSLDAGATFINIDVDKGGIKKLRITDNGSGIVKNELTLALSRHATSKIKNLSDLESISSLGFRGEALASISSVSRLTLTSKTVNQETAWQASAQGRDMDVSIQPAAHPNGTTIEVKDLFFNTPARRKFLRTEKTEFTHIDEVVRRIALARFDVSFTLTHNGKIIRQYKAAQDKSQYGKRVAMVCGKTFFDHAIEVDCRHDNLHLWGWLAKPSFNRSQNDLCYSYVNGRMMRDKLINHAIRQSYADRLVGDSYPAFVLFLELDYSEVDVNVHPAKHEVRFHQARYVHDFIYSVCNNALTEVENAHQQVIEVGPVVGHISDNSLTTSKDTKASAGISMIDFTSTQHDSHNKQYHQRVEYITPLTQVKDSGANYNHSMQPHYSQSSPVQASKAYKELMTPYQRHNEPSIEQKKSLISTRGKLSAMVFIAPGYMVININKELRLLSIVKLAKLVHVEEVKRRWVNGMVSQPLLLPIMISLPEEQVRFLELNLSLFDHAGIVVLLKEKHQGQRKIQIRQFPALLRDKDITASFTYMLNALYTMSLVKKIDESDWALVFADIMVQVEYDEETAQFVINQADNFFLEQLEIKLLLNSVVIDLTSSISQLN